MTPRYADANGGKYSAGFNCKYDNTTSTVASATDVAAGRTNDNIRYCVPMISVATDDLWGSSSPGVIGTEADDVVGSLTGYDQMDWVMFAWAGPEGDTGVGTKCEPADMFRIQMPSAMSSTYPASERLYSCDGCGPCLNETTTDDGNKHYSYAYVILLPLS